MNIPIAMGEYTFYDEDDVEGSLSLMEDVSEYIDTCLEFEKTKSEKGLFMAEGCAEEVIRQCNEFIEKPAQNMLISTFNDRIEEVEGITQRELEQYKKKNYDAVTKLIIPAYERIITTFEELKDTGENQLGLAYYDGGKEYYKYLLKSNVGTDKTPEQVIKLLDKKIRKTMKSFQDLAYKNYDAYVQYYNGADLYGELDPEETIRYFAKFFAKRFPKTPEYEFSVEQIHDSMKGSTSPAFYIVPPVDDYTHNFIFTNPSSENGSGIWSTLAHEGVPGHMYQNVYFYSRMSNPIRAILDYSGYSEGWATYVEMMSFSAYDYDNPVYGKFEKYNNQLNLLLSARLEIGVNYEGWDLGDTRAYLNEEGFNEEVAESVMDYVIAEPVNYQTYCLGWLEFEELRSYAKKHLKDNFSEKEFHQVVLDAGPSPFYILEESVKEYVKVTDIENFQERCEESCIEHRDR